MVAAKTDAPAAAPAAKGKRGSKAAAPTAETREFWETWAEEKSTRVEEPAPAKAAPAAAAASDEAEEAAPAKGRERGGRGRGRDKRETKLEVPAAKAVEAEKPERAGRAKRDTTVDTSIAGAAKVVSGGGRTVAPVGEAGQARLFVNLGKKHGVSADQLRALLAGPVGGDTARIGSVSMRDSHAHVRVPEELAEAIIGGVHGTSHADQSVTVERARA